MNSLMSLHESDEITSSPEPSLALEDTSPELARVSESAATDGLFHVELARVKANPFQPRRTFEPVALAQLAESLKVSGLIQPIVIRRVGEDFELVAGERRLRAARLAGLSTLPAIVRTVDSTQQAQLALIENIHREDLNPIERAAAYRQLLDQDHLTQEQLAERLGEDRSTIANFVRLLELAEPVQQALSDALLSLGHAKILAGVKVATEQQRLSALVIRDQLSVRALESLVSATPKTVSAEPKKSASAHISDLEKRLSRTLEMRVEIRQAKRAGKDDLLFTMLRSISSMIC